MNDELTEPEIALPDEELTADASLPPNDLFRRLQATFPEPAYITLQEVRDATGFDGHRTADAIAISLYRSRGKALWGFEFKVSRNDWLKELKQPEKSESILRFCDYWALIVPDKSIVKEGELPPTWGLYVTQKNRLKCVVPCPKLEPESINRTMLTALAYAIDKRRKQATEAELKAAREAGYKEGVKRGGWDRYEEYYTKLREKVDAFDKASGLHIEYGWQKPFEVGKAVSLLLTNSRDIQSKLRTAKYAAENVSQLKETLDAQIAEIEKALASLASGEEESDEDSSN